MSIIQITGTYGSGKTTIVRSLLPLYSGVDLDVPGKRPLGHYLNGKIFLVGDYRSNECGGADKIKPLDLVFNIVREQHALGYHVIMEGIYLMSKTRVIPLMKEGIPLTILQLTTSLDESLAGIAARRAMRGDEKEVNPKKTTDHFKLSQSYCANMRALGVSVIKVTRETGPAQLRELLGGSDGNQNT